MDVIKKFYYKIDKNSDFVHKFTELLSSTNFSHPEIINVIRW